MLRTQHKKLCTSARNALFRGLHTATEGSKPKYFDKILIANRGEIACRVIQTCRKLGIKTVAVYSDADAHSKHVRLADEAVRVGTNASSDSYLKMEAILDAIKKTGAQAVHPGYGFLSENQAFVKMLEENGVTFIGPKSFAIHAMGDKIESKKLAKSAGVSTIPGFLGEVNTDEEVLKIANEIGYPVMIKASAGGGGKGMRIAWNDKEAIEGYHLSKTEAKKSFGDDRMLIEKFIDNPRHIEIQIIADSQGNTIYLPERECSIQRRNQKVIEEAPSCALDPATRRAMGEQAAALARAVQYQSAGTVEMLVDSQKNFYFLEMNTRLQVEHPITEYITNIDLVEQMIRVAAGHPLPFKQEDIKIHGWAVESRVYAEDPYRNFLPSIGTLKTYKEPGKGDSEVRVDSGIQEGSEISVFYDPMICKLITHGNTRADAISKMRGALDTYVIRGVNHNVSFLRAVLENERFLSGNLSTKFIPEEFPNGFKGFELNQTQTKQLLATAAVMEIITAQRSETLAGRSSSSKTTHIERVQSLNDKEHSITVSQANQGYTVTVDGDELHVSGVKWDIGGPVFTANVNGEEVIAQLLKRKSVGVYQLQFFGTVYDVTVLSPREKELIRHMPIQVKLDTTKYVLSPMPGAVVSVFVKPGDKVVTGQDIAVVEAMKMQNVLKSERDATVKAVFVKPGQSVAVEDQLVEFQ